VTRPETTSNSNISPERVDLVVGFDLDMTLVDPRPGVRAALRALGLNEFLAESLGPRLDD
jgi:phosphoglycolate phosphatase